MSAENNQCNDQEGATAVTFDLWWRYLDSIDCPIGTTHSLTVRHVNSGMARSDCDEDPWRRCHWFSCLLVSVRYASTRGPELAAGRPRAPRSAPKKLEALNIWNLKVPRSFGIRMPTTCF